LTPRKFRLAKCGRRPVLDQYKKREIVVIISMGHSRRTAARYVGCAPSTITNTAERDVAFAKSLRQADLKSEIDNMKNIQEAAKKAQYWRAAAWILERRNPEDFGPKNPNALTIDDMRLLLAEFVQIIMEEITVAKYRKRLLKRLDVLTARFQQPLPEIEAVQTEE
jgi:hypothetical protein